MTGKLHKTLQLRIRGSIMSYFLCWCLLLASFRGVFSGKEILYRGMSGCLFPNMGVDKDVSLYVNGKENSTIIARWPIALGTTTDDRWIKPEYSTKFYIDKNRNIWICNVDQKDARKYFVVYDINTKGPEAELAILENVTEEKQLQECFNSHPNFTENYSGKLTEKQIGEMRKWLDDHPDFIKKHLETSPYMTTVQYWNKFREGINLYTTTAQSQKDDTEGRICPETDDRITAILVILIMFVIIFLVRCLWFAWIRYKKSKKTLTENQDQKWQHDHPDSIEKNIETLTEDQVTKWLYDHPDFTEELFGVKLTGREVNPSQQASSQKNFFNFETDNNCSSDSVNVSGHVVMQPINKDVQKANPEGGMAHTQNDESTGEPNEELNSDDECRISLIRDQCD